MAGRKVGDTKQRREKWRRKKSMSKTVMFWHQFKNETGYILDSSKKSLKQTKEHFNVSSAIT
jgi:hypothetical protein